MNSIVQDLAKLEVIWEGTDSGLMPTLIAHPAGAVIEFDDAALPQLIDALADEKLFAAAHVLLTQRAGVTHETFPTWNQLHVELAAEGSVKIDPEQRHALAASWRRWYANASR